MTASTLYQIASVIFVLFALGHTLGFLKFKAPTSEGVAVREAMGKVVFTVGGKPFSYERFYVGFGLVITVSLLFSAFLSWHLSTLARTNPAAIGNLGWVFFGVQVASIVLSYLYFFPITAVFSGLVAVCVGWAAWLVR
jgi:hypothetical protein